MRISTALMFSSGTQNLLQLQSGLYKLQNQMSTGRRVLTPADDPISAAQGLVISQQQSVGSQFLDNQSNAASQLTLMDDRLNSVASLMQSVKDAVIQAGNGAYSDSNRLTIAADIRQRYDELVGLANSSDAMGQYIFSGFRGDTQPFSVAGSPGARTATYHGDDGRRQLQVDTGRQMDVTESGSDVFTRIPQGNGQFMSTAGAANTGSAVLGSSSAITGFDGSTYQLTFTAPNTYTLDVTTNGVLASSTPGQTYVSGSDIVLGPAGQQFKISLSGTPAAGDVFTVAPSTNQDVFKTLDSMIKTLESSTSGAPLSQAAFQNQMKNIGENVDQAMSHLLSVQTSIGVRRQELDALTSVGGNLQLQYKDDISRLQDLDYTQAISDMSNQKMVLEAAQLSFKQVSQMSLFTYL